MMEKIQLNNPTLILWGGVAASGKSTFLEKIISKVNDTLVIDKDLIADSFLTQHAESEIEGVDLYKLSWQKIPRPGDYYSEHVRFQHYYCMLELAKDNLRFGKNPIVSGNFSNLIPMRYLEEVIDPFFEEVQHKRKIVYCHAPEQIIRKRMEKRAEPRDLQFYETDEAWEAYVKGRPIVPEELEKYDHIKINTSEDDNLNIEKLLNYLFTE